MKIKIGKSQWEEIGKKAGWMEEEEEIKLLHEGDVFYTFDKPTDEDPTWHEFQYVAAHIPSKKEFVKNVFCHNYKDFLTLLNLWNRSENWKYRSK